MSQFELNWVGEYIPKLVSENDFLNEKLENDTYGIYYSVLFENDADTYLLQAKIPPEEGVPEWGMIEMSKSGKSKRFKRVKRDDSGTPDRASKEPGYPSKAAADQKYLKDATTTCIQIYNGSLNYAKEAGLNLIDNVEDRRKYLEYVQEITEELMTWVEKARS